MASTSFAKQTLVPMKEPVSSFNAYPPPLNSYEEVVADPKLFLATLEKDPCYNGNQVYKNESWSNCTPGIDFSMFEESELLKVDVADIYHLAVKAKALPTDQNVSDGDTDSGAINSQITQVVFEKENGEYQTRLSKQILCVNGMRYELQEIYGLGDSVHNDVDDANYVGKECVICLSEPRDRTILPCRHMYMCSYCAKVLGCQTNRCPICRQPVERILEIIVSNGTDE